MRKILLLLVLFASVAFSAIDECKTDVYFGNGILTNEGNATANTLLLKKSIKDALYGGKTSEMKKHIGKVKEAYNHTFGFRQDIFESGLQITNLAEYVDWWARHLPRYKKSVHEADLRLQVDKYEAREKIGVR